jgi:hypothetical protein
VTPPPEQRVVPRFAAEPPQEALPYGRWAERLGHELLAACRELEDTPEDLDAPDDPGAIVWYPDRTWHGRTYVPGTCVTSAGYELFGYVRFIPPSADDVEPSAFFAHADFTEETAERNPDWKLDLCNDVIGGWRGHAGATAAMTLVWGRPLVAGGRVATAELGDVVVDQCELIEERFTLIAPDDYRHDLLEIKLFGGNARELARESLYEEGEEEDSGEEDAEDSTDLPLQ